MGDLNINDKVNSIYRGKFVYLKYKLNYKIYIVKGHKVKVKYQATKEEEKKAKREAVARVMLQALKRMKEKK
jgi:hypothetical protein